MLWDGPIIDIHTHILSDGSGMRERPDGRRDLLASADYFGFERLVVMPLYGGMHPSSQEINAGNDAVARLAAEDRRVVPFVTVYPPHQPGAGEEVDRRINHEGFGGLKVWCSLADQPFMDELLEIMAAAGKPTLIHALHKAWDYADLPGGQYPTESRPRHIAALARRHPGARIIMAHAGGDFLWSCDAIRDQPNVWTDISGTYCETGMVEHAVETLGPRRVLFGTDLPGASVATNLAKVLAADIDRSTMARILYHNALEVLS